MNQYLFTPAAQRDLSSIWDFTEERWDISQAEAYIREIQAAVERLAGDPRRGHAREEIREGYRSYPAGSHKIFYLQHASHIEVVRILHQRMDVDRHL